MRVLIAYDGSPVSETVLQDLPFAGLPPQAEALVISVADVWLPPDAERAEPPGALAESIHHARERALAELAAYREIAAAGARKVSALFPGWTVDSFACGDSPSWGIIHKAGEWKADLVMVGTHGRHLLERFFLGSVGHRVAAEAPCSVRVARVRPHPKHTGLRILMAVDGGVDAAAGVDMILQRPWPADTRFDLVTVMDPRMETAMAWPSTRGGEWVEQHFKDAGDWVCRMVESLARRFREAGRTVETHVCEGDPKQVLVKQAERLEADSLFLGARGLHHGNRWFLGSVASAVAARAHCTVEIMRPRR